MKRLLACTAVAVAVLFAPDNWLLSQQVSKVSSTQARPKAITPPEAVVGSLYREVIARHPVGIPHGADMKIFAPYFSKALLHRIDMAIACGDDWHRQNPGFSLKPEYGWLELGFFSGGDEEAAPSAFVVEKTQTERDGSTRVHIKLTYEEPHDRPWTWRVATVLLRENGHYVVDDVVYVKKRKGDMDGRLSALLSEGCDGPRWVGYSERR